MGGRPFGDNFSVRWSQGRVRLTSGTGSDEGGLEKLSTEAKNVPCFFSKFWFIKHKIELSDAVLS